MRRVRCAEAGIESNPRREDTLAFQVDLWSSQGALPRNLAEVATRHKEIQFSSRTRASTAQFKNVHRVQRAIAALLRRLPANLEENGDLKILKSVASDKVYNIIHLIYRARNYEGHSKDYEFSRLSMQDHWRRAITMPYAHFAILKFLPAPRAWMACSRSISNATVVNDQSHC